MAVSRTRRRCLRFRFARAASIILRTASMHTCVCYVCVMDCTTETRRGFDRDDISLGFQPPLRIAALPGPPLRDPSRLFPSASFLRKVFVSGITSYIDTVRAEIFMLEQISPPSAEDSCALERSGDNRSVTAFIVFSPVAQDEFGAWGRMPFKGVRAFSIHVVQVRCFELSLSVYCRHYKVVHVFSSFHFS